MVIPMDKVNVEQAAANIQDHLNTDLLQPSDKSRKAVEDFLLAAEVGAALTREGHNTEVEAEDGAVTIIINKHVLMLSRLEEELKSIAARVSGVKSVNTRWAKTTIRRTSIERWTFRRPQKCFWWMMKGSLYRRFRSGC
jgi:two-component system response regulator CpxR